MLRLLSEDLSDPLTIVCRGPGAQQGYQLSSLEKKALLMPHITVCAASRVLWKEAEWGYQSTLNHTSTLPLQRLVLCWPRKVALKRVRGKHKKMGNGLYFLLIETMSCYSSRMNSYTFNLWIKWASNLDPVESLSLLPPALCSRTWAPPGKDAASLRAGSWTWKESPPSSSAPELNQSTKWKGWWQLHTPMAKVLRETANC